MKDPKTTPATVSLSDLQELHSKLPLKSCSLIT
jgi:hypothetical protein